MVRVPDPLWEDLRQLHREREQLRKDRNRSRNRLSSTLVAQRVRVGLGKGLVERLEQVHLVNGEALPAHLKAGLMRDWERLQVVEGQLRAVEGEIRVLIKDHDALTGVRALMVLPGAGWVGAWTLVLEIFGWREIANRSQLASLVGLVPPRPTSAAAWSAIRASARPATGGCGLLIELAWLWLRYQPQSTHSRWLQERFGGGSKAPAAHRHRGPAAASGDRPVAVFLESGLVPEGGRLKLA